MLQKLEKMRGAFSKSIECFGDCKFNFAVQFDDMAERVNTILTESRESLAKRMQDDNDLIGTYCECFDVHFKV